MTVYDSSTSGVTKLGNLTLMCRTFHRRETVWAGAFFVAAELLILVKIIITEGQFLCWD